MFLQGFAQELVPLWPEGVPNQKQTKEKERITNRDILWIENVQKPSLEVYLPYQTKPKWDCSTYLSWRWIPGISI